MIHFQDEEERLIAEQAVLAHRAVKEAADTAEFGRGLEAIEDAALEASRDQGRRLIESALRHVAAEKGRASARAAGDAPTSSDRANGR